MQTEITIYTQAQYTYVRTFAVYRLSYAVCTYKVPNNNKHFSHLASYVYKQSEN